MSISPSFFSKADRCLRRAAFGRWGEKYGYTREPQGTGAQFGDELHRDNAEPYLSEGKMPDRLTKAGELFLYGLPFLPAPGVGGVEGSFELQVSGVNYTGKIDYRGPLPARALFLGQHTDVSEVTLDHKTSSNPLEYGLWEKEDWLNDPQSIIYGARTLIQDKSAQSVNLRWLYYWTRGKPRAKPSDMVLTRGEIEGRFGEWIHPLSFRLTKLLEEKLNPNELPCNTAACNDFNKPCHYLADCKRTTEQMLEGSLIAVENLKKKKEQQKMTPANPGLGNLAAALANLGGPAPVAPVAQQAFVMPQAAPIVPSGGLNLGVFDTPAAPVSAPAVVATPGLNLGAFGMVGAPSIGVNAPESRGPVAVELAPKPVAQPTAQHVAGPVTCATTSNAFRIVCEELAQAFTRAAARL